jgi:hypothetical protein
MGTWWCNQFLPFCCHTLPAIFNLFASALKSILPIQRGWEQKLHYLEDFLAIFPPSAASNTPDWYNSDCSQICTGLGFRVKKDKKEDRQ